MSAYQHKISHGLPTSLTQGNGKTVAAVELMHQRGLLNRDIKRELLSDPSLQVMVPKKALGVAHHDLMLMTLYGIPGLRFASFWRIAQKRANGQGTAGRRSFALAIDSVLLDAYEPAWERLTLDEDELKSVCAEWPVIRAGIEERLEMDPTIKHPPFGVFMLWSRLVSDLPTYSQAEKAKQQALAWTAFALSSISGTDWFMSTALNLCPALEDELGALLANTDGGTEDTKALDPQREWDSLLDRVQTLTGELTSTPTTERVDELLQAAERLATLARELPFGAKTAGFQAFEEQLASLITYLRGLRANRAFEWLDDELISQLEARWSLVRSSATDEDAASLSTQVVESVGRCREAEGAVVAATDELDKNRTLLEGVLAQASAAVEATARRVAERRRAEHQQRVAGAESAVHAAQDTFLAAASPGGAAFDHSIDYRAGPPTLEVGDIDNEIPRDVSVGSATAPSAAVSIAAAAAPDNGNAPDTNRRSETLGTPEPPETAADGVSVKATELRPAAGPSASPQAAPPAPERPKVPESAEDEAYSVEAGERCRPIWRYLKDGRPGLAYQLARLMAADGEIRVPAPPLLASITLTKHLLLSDGPIQEALTSHFGQIDEQDFRDNTAPSDWRTAMNLLLAASTLRPMVISPGSGASSIAGYLHLGPGYPTLYSLVDRLRHLADRLQGFRIEPNALRSARSDSALHDEQTGLAREAQDWLNVQAPAVTIKFAPATNVWRTWLKPGGEIFTLVSPVATNRQADLQQVRDQVQRLSNEESFGRAIRDTDRKRLKRMKGEDIHAGAFEHLIRCTQDALSLARRWMSLVELRGQTGGRARSLLQEVREVLLSHREGIRRELQGVGGSNWMLVESAQSVVSDELDALWQLFDPASPVSLVEPDPKEALSRDLLLVPAIRIDEDWSIQTGRAEAIAALAAWATKGEGLKDAFDARAVAGDLLGAGRLSRFSGLEELEASLRREREAWRVKLRRSIDDARRDIEVGSAYGYLTDAARTSGESELVRWEAQLDDLLRYDVALEAVEAVKEQVRRYRNDRTEEVRGALSRLPSEAASEVPEVERVLEQGDIATANELVQRLRQGLPAWPEAQGDIDKFAHFFPNVMLQVEDWIGSKSRKEVEKAIANGAPAPGLNFGQVPGAQRGQASQMFAVWSDLKAQESAEQGRLERLFRGLGFTVDRVSLADKHPLKEIWSLDAQPIDDRTICANPQFGSAARGRYRVACIWGRPTEDDILQCVGDAVVQRPTIVLYFGRMTERKWRDISRLAKSKRKSFLLLDETMLVYLCAQSGSRAAALFEVALPFAYSTPYDATAGLVAPEMFYGRGAELDAVRGLNGRCFVYGGRQLGKTALLRRAEQSFHAPAQGRYAGWIDLRAEGIGVSRNASDVWSCIADRLTGLGVLKAGGGPRALTKKGAVEELVSEIRQFIAKDDESRVLLLLDEGDRFFEQDGRNDFAETRRLKQLMDDTGRRFKVVFAGLHNVLRMTERANHPLAHFGEPIRIGPLVGESEIREAESLVRNPLQAAGFSFEARSLIMRVLAQTNYYPSLIQLYCSHLSRHMLERFSTGQKPQGPRYVITDRDIESVYSSGALREEIRNKFGLTLQLDPRYEVVAYAMAHAALGDRFAQSVGMDWQGIRQLAFYWWAEGFKDTSELDFRVLLDEMVELGVLSKIRDGSYTLRNPNVLLLLGSRDEIEAVLVKDREPSAEFESAAFRPPLRASLGSARRHPLTYQQLSELLRPANSITVIAGTRAGGVYDVLGCMQDYVGNGRNLILLGDALDRQQFSKHLEQAMANRRQEGVTLVVIPPTVPWTAGWIETAAQRVAGLRSESKQVSLAFVAEPATLWRVLSEHSAATKAVPWMSLLPWKDGFVRQWLEDLQLSNDPGIRKQIQALTGNWGALLQDLVQGCNETQELKRRLNKSEFNSGDARREMFGANTNECFSVLRLMAELDEPVDPPTLAELIDGDAQEVEKILRWAELLGVVSREDGGSLVFDPVARSAYLSGEA